MDRQPLNDEARYALFQSQAPALMRDFYDRLFSDIMIDFFFMGRDKQALIDKQIAFMGSLLGGPEPYKGASLREAHEPLNIFEGQFNRRHQVLKDVLAAHAVEPWLAEPWLTLDRELMERVIKAPPCR